MAFKNIVWIGTSISKALDSKKLEEDTNMKVKVVKSYGIKRECNQRFPASNFTEMVPKVIKQDNPDAVVLQTGSIEITNIDVKKALMDPFKSIEQYKQEWTDKVKDDSNNLFNVAKTAVKMKPDIEVVILKRLPRYDPKSTDPLHIKQSLSELANSVYDQLWLEDGGPKNIHIVSLDKMECFGYLKDIIYGKTNDSSYDGIHLRGPAAVRHFTYRAANAIKSVFGRNKNRVSNHVNSAHSQRTDQYRPDSNYHNGRNKNGGLSNYSANHDDCPQAKYQWRVQSRLDSASVQTENKTGTGHQQVGSTYYTIPVQNRFPEKF